MSEYARMPAGTPISELLDFTEEYSNALEAIKRERAAEEAMPEKELVLWTGIAGLQHHVDTESRKGKKLLKSLAPGTELILKREPENPYDRWAIIVETKEGKQTRWKTSLEPLNRVLWQQFSADVAKSNQNRMSAERSEELSKLYATFEKRLGKTLSPFDFAYGSYRIKQAENSVSLQRRFKKLTV